MTLVEFLRARLDEDEQLAAQAAIPAHDAPHAYKPHPELAAWSYEPGGEVEYVSTPEMLRHEYADTYRVTADSEGLLPAVDESVGPHIARHDPARVLAEVDAKRRIVELHEHSHSCVDANGMDDYVFTDSPSRVYCATLHLIALPYADHPDYQEEWRP